MTEYHYLLNKSSYQQTIDLFFNHDKINYDDIIIYISTPKLINLYKICLLDSCIKFDKIGILRNLYSRILHISEFSNHICHEVISMINNIFSY